MKEKFLLALLISFAAVTILVSAPGQVALAQDCEIESFCVSYFDNRFLEGQPTYVDRLDSFVVDRDWGTGAADFEVCVENCGKADAGSPVFAPVNVGVGEDNFSIRYEGTFEFATSSDFKFVVGADDGVRLWVDDRLLIDRWHDQPFSVQEIAVPLDLGPHHIKLEYYEHGGSAKLLFLWTRIPRMG
jgi:hypothetical protein